MEKDGRVNEIFSAFKSEVTGFASDNFADIKQEAINDSMEFFNALKSDLSTWTMQLANGEMSKADYEWLLKSQKDLAQMNLLKQKGVSQARVDHLKKNALSFLVSATLNALAPKSENDSVPESTEDITPPDVSPENNEHHSDEGDEAQQKDLG